MTVNHLDGQAPAGTSEQAGRRIPFAIAGISSSTVMLGILALGFYLRLDRISAHAIWNDEAYSIYLAGLSLSEMAAKTASDIHPPLYYALLHFWIGFAGTSEFAVRALSTLLGLPLLALLFVLGRSMGGVRLGLATAFVAGVSPFFVYYAQDTRMYALLGSLVSAAAIFAWRAVGQANWHTWVPGYIAVSALALYTHFYAMLAFVAFNAAYAFLALPGLWAGRTADGGRALRLQVGAWSGAQLATLGLFWPWLPVLFDKNAAYFSPGRGTPLDATLLILGRDFAVGEALKDGVLDLYVAAAWALALVGLAVAFVVSRRGNGERRLARGAAFAAVWFLVALATIVITSFGKRDFAARYLLAGAPAFCLMLGIAAVSLGRWWRPLGGLALALLVVGTGLALGPYHRDPNFSRGDHRSAIRGLEKRAQPGDVVVLDAPYTYPVFEYYYRGDLPWVGLPASVTTPRATTEKALADLAGQYKRLWAIYWQDYYADEKRVVENWLDSHALRFYQEAYLGYVRLTGYELRPSGELDLGKVGRLTGFKVTPSEPKAGGTAQVVLNWRGRSAPKQGYQVFVHLVDGQGRLVAQHDSAPDGGKAPTSVWQSGIIVLDPHPLAIPADLPAGDYELRVGMYSLDDLKRLPTAGGDYIRVGTVQVAGRD